MARELVVTSDGKWCMYMGRLPQEDHKPKTPTHDEPTHALFIHDATWTCVFIMHVTSNHLRLPAFCVSTAPDPDGRWIIAVETSRYGKACVSLFVFDPVTTTIVALVDSTNMLDTNATALAIVRVRERHWSLECFNGRSIIRCFYVHMHADCLFTIRVRNGRPIVGNMLAEAMLSLTPNGPFRAIASDGGVRIYHHTDRLPFDNHISQSNAHWSPGSWIQHPQTKQWRFASYNYQLRVLWVCAPDDKRANDTLFFQKDWYGDAEVAWLSWDRLLFIRERYSPSRYEVDVYAVSSAALAEDASRTQLTPVSAFVAYGLTNMKALPGGRALLVYDEDEWQLGRIKHATVGKLPLVWTDHVHARWAPLRFRMWVMMLTCGAQRQPWQHMPVEVWLLVFEQMYPMYTATYLSPQPIPSTQCFRD
jgi:hypothetical protein